MSTGKTDAQIDLSKSFPHISERKPKLISGAV